MVSISLLAPRSKHLQLQPKSIKIARLFSLSYKMFSGFMSLWQMCLLWMYYSPSITSNIMCLSSFFYDEKIPLHFIFKSGPDWEKANTPLPINIVPLSCRSKKLCILWCLGDWVQWYWRNFALSRRKINCQYWSFLERIYFQFPCENIPSRIHALLPPVFFLLCIWPQSL